MPPADAEGPGGRQSLADLAVETDWPRTRRLFHPVKSNSANAAQRAQWCNVAPLQSGNVTELAAQRAHAIKRRKAIWEALHPNSGATCASIGPGRPKEFAAETAEVAGESKSQINRHLARAEALGGRCLN